MGAFSFSHAVSALNLKFETEDHLALIDVACVLCGSKNATLIKEKLGYRVNQCKDCEMIYVNPRPSPDALKEIYNDPKSNFYNGEYAQALELEKETLKQIVSSLKSRLKSGKIFEIGCSNGDLLKLAQKAGFEVEGCDLIDQNAIRQKTDFPIYEKTLIELKLKSASYDAIIIRNTFEHYFDPAKELAEIKRLLKPGGLLYLKVPNVQFEYGLLCKLAFQVDNLFAPPFHLNHYSPKTLTHFLSIAGFSFQSWQVEIPSQMQGTIKNLIRNFAHKVFIVSSLLPGAPVGSGATLACIVKKNAES